MGEAQGPFSITRPYAQLRLTHYVETHSTATLQGSTGRDSGKRVLNTEVLFNGSRMRESGF